ncbi:magnesium chelatase subunit D [uncultured Ruminococcus sp.]|uniref:vWA domain-containing protein n=1 Tax=Huintestinicola butyrica TaxID=2981728 RepID=UPI000821113B|nr:von Willebrand factor type A domain-containing protein [Huintestinicola butyrica]MCU6726752.1 von Willebrand factor type A domain-containing protein [Huintestinicola butyrica]SCI59781.1 magnesium chelatase subunit D [uncultured Ruminococcus sp.]
MNTKMNSMRKLAAVMAVVSSVTSLTACGAASTDEADSYTRGQNNVQYNSTEAAAGECAPADYDEAPADNADFEQNDEEYNYISENGYTAVSSAPLSTFSADVDTASYTNVRRMIDNGSDVPPDAVRIEEFINYFDYDYTDPADGEPFAVHTELSDCPWNDETELLMVGINTKGFDAVLDERPAMNLVFLIDVSGSMYDDNKLPLVQKSFSMLTDNLTAADRVSIVTYAGSDEVVLEGADGNDRKKILRAINDLEAGGSTAGAAGINTAYDIAQKYFIDGGNNRVILATDGDLNVGLSSESELTRLIEEKRESGVFLSVLGFGTGNYKDNRLEALADYGNGNYSYIDSEKEAKKVLVDEMSGTLFTVAKDVKFQLEFNPANVKGYRLIGYENRVMAAEDFNDDTKDAGEIGAGHSVTVLYEIVLADSKMELGESKLKYASDSEGVMGDELLTVNIRYKEPEGSESKLLTYPVNKSLYSDKMSADMNFASCVAEFGMLLRNSRYIGDVTYKDVSAQLSKYDYSDDDYKDEFIYLVNTMKRRDTNFQ